MCIFFFIVLDGLSAILGGVHSDEEHHEADELADAAGGP
jgi:hypothetical protein